MMLLKVNIAFCVFLGFARSIDPIGFAMHSRQSLYIPYKLKDEKEKLSSSKLQKISSTLEMISNPVNSYITKKILNSGYQQNPKKLDAQQDSYAPDDSVRTVTSKILHSNTKESNIDKFLREKGNKFAEKDVMISSLSTDDTIEIWEEFYNKYGKEFYP